MSQPRKRRNTGKRNSNSVLQDTTNPAYVAVEEHAYKYDAFQRSALAGFARRFPQAVFSGSINLHLYDAGNPTFAWEISRHTGRLDVNREAFDWKSFSQRYLWANPKVPLVAVFVMLSFGTNPEGHINILLFDKRTRTVDHFDPNGFALEEVKDAVRSTMQSLGWRYQEPELTCPRVRGLPQGLQQMLDKNSRFAGTCAMWSLWYIEQRLEHPDESGKAILQAMMHDLGGSAMEFEDFIREFTHDIAQTQLALYNFHHTLAPGEYLPASMADEIMTVECNCGQQRCAVSTPDGYGRKDDLLLKQAFLYDPDPPAGVEYWTKMVPLNSLDETQSSTEEVPVRCKKTNDPNIIKCVYIPDTSESPSLSDTRLANIVMPYHLREYCEGPDENLGAEMTKEELYLTSYGPEWKKYLGLTDQEPEDAICVCTGDGRYLGCSTRNNVKMVKSRPACPGRPKEMVPSDASYKYWRR